MSTDIVVRPIDFLGYGVLGLSVLIHIVFVSITLGTGLITAYYRWIAYRRLDVQLEALSRKMFKILVISELFSGVWGTIITVVLAGMFTSFMALATNVLFIPIMMAVISIMIRIPSIATFWYSWDKVAPRTHVVIGFTMAISGFGIPLGFRALFAETTMPNAIKSYLSTGYSGMFEAFSSPIFHALYLHTVLAAISIGGFVIASLLSLDNDKRGVFLGMKIGMIFLLAQMIAGPLYWYTLRHYSKSVYETITFGSFSPIFAIKLLLLILLIAIYVRSRATLKGNDKLPNSARYVGLLAIMMAILGEVMNDASKYPYLVIMGEDGLPISMFTNYYMSIPFNIVYLVLGFLIVSIVIFTSAAYLALVKKYIN